MWRPSDRLTGCLWSLSSSASFMYNSIYLRHHIRSSRRNIFVCYSEFAIDSLYVIECKSNGLVFIEHSCVELPQKGWSGKEWPLSGAWALIFLPTFSWGWGTSGNLLRFQECMCGEQSYSTGKKSPGRAVVAEEWAEERLLGGVVETEGPLLPSRWTEKK